MLVVLETTSLDSDFDDKEDEVKLSTAELDSLTTLDSVAAELYELVSIDDVVSIQIRFTFWCRWSIGTWYQTNSWDFIVRTGPS